MEELRSTEVLDREIRADSRKRAERILVQAEENAKSILEGVTARVAKAKAESEKKSEERFAVYEKNVDASLPLEKQRYFVSYIQNSVKSAINEYLEKLTEKKRFEIVARLIDRSLPVINDKKIEALVAGFKLETAEKVLNSKLGKNLVSCKVTKDSAYEDKQGVILKSSDGKITCRLTIDEKINELLDQKNSELAEVLFNGRFPE